MNTNAKVLRGHETPEEAIAALVEAQGGRLYSLGLRFCGDPEEARDLVQETFLQAYKNWGQFQGRSSVATWLYTIASRVCKRMHRKKSGEPQSLDPFDETRAFGATQMGVVPLEQDGPLFETVREEGKRRIETAIAGLPLEFRMPLVLKEIVGLSLAEVASVLDIKEATIKTRVHRARLRIRESLEDVLPKKEMPPPLYAKQVCLDLLHAKQVALDRGVPFEFPDQVICERCFEFFAAMDFAKSVCIDVARGHLPESLQKELLLHIEAGA